MPDENKNTDPNQGADTAAADEQKAGEQTPDTSTDKTEGGEKPKTFTQDDVNRLIAKERKDAEKKAKMSEDERLKSDLEDARSQLRERDTKDAVQTEATRAGAKNSALIYKAVKDEITFDKDGKPENIKEVLAQAKKDFPELFGAKSNGSADGGEGKAPAQNNSLDNQIRQALGLT